MAVNMVGVAAHIHAAASGPGARRYLATMTPEERSHIDNAIWLCATHATMIDRDETTYTADMLRAMKREHEANSKATLAASGTASGDLIAIGPNVVFVGEFLGTDGGTWSVRLHHFVEGDEHALISFIEQFPQSAAIARYLLVNSLGDGRVLSGAPTMHKERDGYTVRCPVLPSAARLAAAELPRDFAMSESHDLMVKNGDIATVSGLDALPQRVKSCLSHQSGESPFYRDFGTRLAEYYRLLRDSPWFDRLLKLEVIRQAAIPYVDRIQNRQHTPLLCVERVHGIEVLADAPVNNWLPIRVDLEVRGVGKWVRELTVYIPQQPMIRPSLEELTSGPTTARS